MGQPIQIMIIKENIMIPTTKIITSSGVMSSDIYSDEFKNRRIYLTDKIDDALASDICAQINCLASQSKEDIYLIINSPGGSVSSGMAILDTMNTCKCDIATVVLGEAASMGAFLASCGTKGKRYAGTNSELMLHQPLGGASGQASDIERIAVHISNVKKKLHSILARNTGQSYDKICADCDRDFYLTVEEAISYGLIDKIFTGFVD